jgi:hypothetical protein
VARVGTRGAPGPGVSLILCSDYWSMNVLCNVKSASRATTLVLQPSQLATGALIQHLGMDLAAFGPLQLKYI